MKESDHSRFSETPETVGECHTPVIETFLHRLAGTRLAAAQKESDRACTVLERVHPFIMEMELMK